MFLQNRILERGQSQAPDWEMRRSVGTGTGIRGKELNSHPLRHTRLYCLAILTPAFIFPLCAFIPCLVSPRPVTIERKAGASHFIGLLYPPKALCLYNSGCFESFRNGCANAPANVRYSVYARGERGDSAENVKLDREARCSHSYKGEV
jgi:hypothetical protein